MNNYFLYELLRMLSSYYEFNIIEQRERIQRFNNKLSLYVFDERNAKHHRPHAHIFVNNQKLGIIWLDTFEIEKFNYKDSTIINNWLKEHKKDLIEAWDRNNNQIDINF